ncbi:hypothetical protein MNBD_GAMMA15-1676 [hydrothermal vent metagenome]|uniref:Uncharacterized protein n=1 Tax=hydrothermal vent metagenome TaxID=652676 RepID=A0A3B0YHT8_9ZZZZ
MTNSNIHQYISTFIFILILGGYAVMAFNYPAAYIWATYEDMYGEWTQTFLFSIALFFSLLLVFSSHRQRLFFTLLSAALFYVVMEEISWGQRLLGFETPDFFKRHNLQDETNIHNLLVGPISTTTKHVIEYLLAGSLLLYGLAYPLLLKINWRWALRIESLGLLAPPLYLWPYFSAGAYLELGRLNFNEAEIAEVLIAFSLAAMSAHYWILHRNPEKASALKSRTLSLKLGFLMIGIIGVATASAFITTEVMLSNPESEARINGRVLNGYEKFARRYELYHRWQTALTLYLAVHRNEPSRTSIMRKIANCYKELGNNTLFLQYNQMALDTALKIYATKPHKVSTNLSLARSYRQRGDEARAQQHLQRALSTAKTRVEEQPESAHAAYWLAKVYRGMRQYNLALTEYRRAYELNPGSAKYLKEYTKMRMRLGVDD